MSDTDYDVIIAGGGPGGSTAAALLAEHGHRVLLLEKETFPRFHIGESLLPAELPLFARLGFDAAALPAVYKEGADFLDEATGDFARFPFAEGMEGTGGHAWQVERAPFDQALMDIARAKGAECREGVRVTGVDDGEDAMTVHAGGERFRGRFFVDATGRDRLLCKRERSYQRVDGFGLAAVWARFDGLGESAVAELEATGNITVLMVPDGWGWVIPIAGGHLSVGFVSAVPGTVTDDWFHERVAASPFLQRLTTGATLGPVERAGDYSYRNTRPHGPRWGCIGDAAGFLDPVFSSGVALAMTSAEELARHLHPALVAENEADPDLLVPLSAHMERAYQTFGAVIHCFYHTNMVKNLFFYDDPDPALRAGLITVLAGDLWRDDNPFVKMIMRSARRSSRGGRRAPSAEAR
ncbi:MAG: pyridine nucleotide-disulfide oxidoreductase [Sandaracinus sp.]|nr:pyridine nucleotide-disulfide oxidoreductase [Sandaracinus sp.]